MEWLFVEAVALTQICSSSTGIGGGGGGGGWIKGGKLGLSQHDLEVFSDLGKDLEGIY